MHEKPAWWSLFSFLTRVDDVLVHVLRRQPHRAQIVLRKETRNCRPECEDAGRGWNEENGQSGQEGSVNKNRMQEGKSKVLGCWYAKTTSRRDDRLL